MIFNINEELDRIIFQYDLDRYYPEYRKKKAAVDILTEMIENAKHGNKRLIFIYDDDLERKILKEISKGSPLVIFLKNSEKVPEEISRSGSAEIYITFFKGTELLERHLRRFKIAYRWIYDIFEDRGIHFEKAFYCLHSESYDDVFPFTFSGKNEWKNNLQMELCRQKRKLCKEKDVSGKWRALEKCFFLALCLKNFSLAKLYAERLVENDEEGNCFVRAWQKINELLLRIRNELKDRKEKDIVIYWLDHLSYGDEEGMSYLKSMMDRSISFENAFTVTPNTYPALRAMFFGKKEVDDRGYRMGAPMNERTSFLLQELKKNGYVFRVVSGYMNCFDMEHTVGGHELQDSCSMIFWGMLQELLLSEKPMVLLGHVLMETHAPFLNTKMTDADLEDELKRLSVGKVDLDEQLEYYDSFICTKAIRIYMSDHGGWYFRKQFHIHLNIFNAGWEPKKVKAMFSLLDFSKLLLQIIERETVDERELDRGFVEIQRLDTYSKNLIRHLIHEKGDVNLLYFGYKGIVTPEYIYIRFKTGVEWLVSRHGAAPEPDLYGARLQITVSDVGIDTALEQCRNMAGEYPAEVSADERFRYSRYLYRFYELMNEKYNVPRKLLNQMVERFTTESVAVRMGGYHSVMLYNFLLPENRRKVKCFIDRDKRCLCSQYGLPVLTPEQMKSHVEGVKVVVFSSYLHRGLLKDEIEGFKDDIEVIDVYAYLEQNGWSCNGEFYDPKLYLTAKDYEVFSFDEKTSS